MNKAILIGRLGQDPEMRQAGGSELCSFSVAISERWTDKGGQKQERTTWLRIVAWGKLAGICSQILRKGSLVAVEGKISIRDYEAKDGSKKQAIEIVAENVRNLSPKQEQAAPAGFEEDLPF